MRSTQKFVGLLPYTLHKNSNNNSLILLLWKANNGTVYQSGQYYHEFITKINKKVDNDDIDLEDEDLEYLATDFSSKTEHLYSMETIYKKLTETNFKIIQRINDCSYYIYFIPVKLTEKIKPSSGKPCWVFLSDLINTNSIHNINNEVIELYLPFSLLLNNEKTISLLNNIISFVNNKMKPVQLIPNIEIHSNCNNIDDSIEKKESIDDKNVHSNAKFYYCCKKCNNPLFLNTHIIHYHSEYININDKSRLKSYFLHCLTKGVTKTINSTLMDYTEDNNDLNSNQSITGKIYCNKCNNKIGIYNYSGIQCSECKEYIAPAFEIPHSKADCFPL